MEDHKRKKKRGRSKIFRSCFSSFATDEKPFSYDKSDHRNTRDGRLGRPVLMAVSGRKGKDSIPDVGFVHGGVTGTGSGGDGYSKRCSHRRLISRLLKSVWFNSLMVKKIHQSSSKSLLRLDKIKPILSIENTNKSTDDTEHSSNRCTYLFSSSSQTTCNSSNASSSFSSSDQKTSSPTDSINFKHQISPNSRSYLDEKDQNRLASINYWNIRLCLCLLLSLVVLIVYGRIYSILFTSAWLYFLPCRGIERVNSVFKGTELPETDTHQYKKRVIMAGLLDRARNPLR